MKLNLNSHAPWIKAATDYGKMFPVVLLEYREVVNDSSPPLDVVFHLGILDQLLLLQILYSSPLS
jgi:hypothetical protein